MSEYVMVDKEWLSDSFDASKCPEQFHGDGFDNAPCNVDTDEDISCIDCWIKYGNDKIKPAPTSALFAERMEEVLKKIQYSSEEGSCPICDYLPEYGHDADCELGKLLADIQKAKGLQPDPPLTPPQQ